MYTFPFVDKNWYKINYDFDEKNDIILVRSYSCDREFQVFRD